MFLIINTVFFFKYQLKAQWQTSVLFYTHVHLFLFLLVAFYDEKKNLLYLNVFFFCIIALS